MPWTIWNAPSDFDYSSQGLPWPEEEEPPCPACGASEYEACEMWCGSRSLVGLEELEEQDNG